VKRGKSSHRLHGAPDIAQRRTDVLTLKPDPHLGFVMVSPRRAGCNPLQRRGSSDDDPRTELVVREHALPRRPLPQDQDQVCENGLDLALPVEDQVVGPVRLLAMPQCRLSLPLHVGEAVRQDPPKAALPETAKVLGAVTARGMERVVDRQVHLGTVRVERDGAQLHDRPGAGHCPDQTELLEHQVSPSE
jgi:hypothetical protein